MKVNFLKIGLFAFGVFLAANAIVDFSFGGWGKLFPSRTDSVEAFARRVVEERLGSELRFNVSSQGCVEVKDGVFEGLTMVCWMEGDNVQRQFVHYTMLWIKGERVPLHGELNELDVSAVFRRAKLR